MRATARGARRRGGGASSGPTLLAEFRASVDFTGLSSTVGVGFSQTKNGVTLYSNGNASLWPVAHPTAPGVTYEGGSHVFRINMSSPAANELRFDGVPAVEELFTEWSLYLPSGLESPSVGTLPVGAADGNDKFFRLWSESYTQGLKVGASYFHASLGSVGYLGREFTKYLLATNTLLGMGEGGGPWNTNNRHPQPSGFFGSLDFAGRWMRIRIRAKVASSPTANDGVFQLWVDDALMTSTTSLPLYTDGVRPNSFTNGYIMGAKNSGGNGSQMYLDNVRFSTGGFA